MHCSFCLVSCEKSRAEWSGLEREREESKERAKRNSELTMEKDKLLANGFRGLTLKLRVTLGQESVFRLKGPKRVRRNKATLSGLIALNLSHSQRVVLVPFRFYRTLPLEEGGGRDQLRRSCELTIDTITRRRRCCWRRFEIEKRC